MVLLVLGWPAGGEHPVYAQSRTIRFDQLTNEHGLSQNEVFAILQDRKGFMWFGTQDGLNRFDGNQFTQYRSDFEDPRSLSHNWIYALLEDSRGILWIGTLGGGLNRWSPNGDFFVRFRHRADDPDSLSSDRVRVLWEDRQGSLWIGTDDGGLNRLDPVRGALRRFRHDAADPGSLPSDRIRAILEDRRGDLWIGTDGGGLSRFDRRSDTFERVVTESSAPAPSPRVRALLEDRDGYLWVGSYEDGLFRLHPESAGWSRFEHLAEDPRTLSSNRVRAIFQDRDGRIWIGTDNGIDEWNPVSASFTRHRHHPANPHSLSDNRILSLHQDRGGVLWIGTQGGGLNKWHPRAGVFSSYLRTSGQPHEISNNIVSCFAEDPDGSIWVGTYGGGLNRLEPSSGRFRHLRHNPQRADSLGDDRVMSLLVDRRGDLWVGTLSAGLDRLERSADRFLHLRHDPEKPHSLSRDAVSALLEDGDGDLWVGTYGGGLNRLDRETDTFQVHRHDPDDPTSLANDAVISLLEEQPSGVWVGTDGGGLHLLDPLTGVAQRFGNVVGDPTTLPSNTIFSLHLDRNEVLWIGTPRGLSRWLPAARRRRDGVFRTYTERDGLPNNSVFGILEDNGGALWLTSNKGLARFDPETDSFRKFDVTHGLLADEFNSGAYLRASTGEMYIGSSNGLNVFRPEGIRPNDHAPPVVLTSVLKLNQPLSLHHPASQLNELILRHDETVVSFEFAALDFLAPRQNRYAYRLEGFDEGWVDSGKIPRATYTNLAAGEYTFRVKAANNDGIWNEEGASLGLKVLPAPWKTTWAYSLYAAIALTLLLGGLNSLYRRSRRNIEYTRRLELEVRNRTAELAQKNADLEAANKSLKEASFSDSLTGLKNRRFVRSIVAGDVHLLDRYHVAPPFRPDDTRSRPNLLFMVVDLDGFKEVNDSFGHAAGDQVLIQIGQLLDGVCRRSDRLVRWGGDEFLVVGRDTAFQTGEALAERIREAIAEHRFAIPETDPLRLSCSIGFACYPFLLRSPHLISWEQVITIADRALYLAKQRGRNQWVGIQPTAKADEQVAHQPLVLLARSLDELVEEGLVALSVSESRERKGARSFG